MLTERMGRAAATYALLRGTPIGADDALARGLAQEVAGDPGTRALELAHDLAGREPQVVAGIKRALDLAARTDFETTLQFEATEQARSLTSETFERFSSRFSR